MCEIYSVFLLLDTKKKRNEKKREVEEEATTGVLVPATMVFSSLRSSGLIFFFLPLLVHSFPPTPSLRYSCHQPAQRAAAAAAHPTISTEGYAEHTILSLIHTRFSGGDFSFPLLRALALLLLQLLAELAGEVIVGLVVVPIILFGRVGLLEE